MTKFICVFFVALFIVGCKSGGGRGENPSALQPSMEGFSYPRLNPEDIADVQRAWASRDLSAQNVQVVAQQKALNYTVTVYAHRLEERTHYGAVVVPTDGSRASYPVVLTLDGLNQENPSMTLENNLSYYNAQYVMVVPVFRGRTLRFNGQSFFANGDFCDAWDGATDDAIAFLNLVQAHTPEANMQQVLASGYSRGATVALLMAQRDKRVKRVVAGAGPVDFYRQEVANRYGDQYRCQFISGKTPAQSRQRMLASSPLFFNLLPTVEAVHLFQGGADTIVPSWNGDLMHAFLLSQSVAVSYHLYPGLRHDNTFADGGFLRTWNAAHDEFFSSVD